MHHHFNNAWPYYLLAALALIVSGSMFLLWYVLPTEAYVVFIAATLFTFVMSTIALKP